MKTNNKLPLIVAVPVVTGIALIASGIATNRSGLMTAGIAVLFGGSFAIALIVSIITIVSAIRSPSDASGMQKTREDCMNDVLAEASRRASEEAENAESAPSADSSVDRGDAPDAAELMKKHAELEENMKKLAESARKRRKSEMRTRVFGIVFVVAFISFLVVGMGLLGSGHTVVGGVIFACGPALIIGSLIVVKIKEHISISGAKKRGENYVRKFAYVTGRMLSSSSGSSTVYKYELTSDDKIYTAYNRQIYNEGDKVEISVLRKGDSEASYASIVGAAEYGLARGSVERETLGSASADGRKTVMSEAPTVADDPFEVYERKRAAKAMLSEEEQMQKDASLDSADRLRTSSDTEDEEERRAARTVARHALFAELDKLKAIREEEASEEKAREEVNSEVSESPKNEPTVTAAERRSASKVEDKRAAEDAPAPDTADLENAKDAPSRKRTTVAYKGINRKK